MVTIDQQATIRQGVTDVVTKGKFPGFEPVTPEQGLVRYCPKGDDDFQARHGRQLCLEMAVALADLRRGRLVGRWQTTDGVSDTAIPQSHERIGQAIRPQWLCCTGKAKAVQGGIEQFTCDIAGERATGAIGTFFPGPQTEYQQFRLKRAKGRNGPRMPMRIAAANVGQMLRQARAGNAVLRVVKCWHGGDVSMLPMQLNWDIFCRVIDNYGDIGICWRLARQLASEHGKCVRLWVDDLHSLQHLCAEIDVLQPMQSSHGVEVCHWSDTVAVDRVGEVIIEAFACELPAAYLAAMASATPRPCWINFEYLTAEAWADGCHGMASPHPSLPLVKYFYFPGFTAATGGLLRECDLLAARDAEIAQYPRCKTLDISLFCYDTAPVGELLDILAESPLVTRLHVAPGQALAAVAAHLGGSGPWQLGKLNVLPFKFMPQDDFDRLLWRCGINFVRGEDSFVRAQWAGRAFVWQPYRQADEVHLDKLEAFLERYIVGLSARGAAAAVDLFRAWNSGQGLHSAWGGFLAASPEITEHNRQWAARLAGDPDLAGTLVKFCAGKV